MSMFENDQYRWRETYFVLFDSSKRPTLKKLHQKLASVNKRFAFANARADERGAFESITVLAPDDFAAMDVCYLGGEEVVEQAASMVEEMMRTECRPEDRAKLERLKRCDGRFDVLHFEQITALDEEDDCLLYTSDAADDLLCVRCRRSTLCRSRWSPYH